ncbi:MAG: cupin [Pirellulales bacterium]|nr:cupin [Pirellulales bacterium]
MNIVPDHPEHTSDFKDREEHPATVQPHVKPGETVDVQQLAAEPIIRMQSLLVKTDNMQIVHLIIPAGETIPTHEAQGEVILHCLEGRVSFTALKYTHELKAGQLFYFHINEPISIQGIEHASLLVTIITAKLGQSVKLIGN